MDPEPPADLEEAVSQAFSERRCLSAAEAEDAIHDRLLDLGRTEWEIEWGPGVRANSCVSGAIDTANGRILLLSALRPEVRDALAGVADDLLEQCLGEDEAATLVTSVLTRLGETGWELRTDGPIGGPIDRLDEIERHVAAGCFIYSGTGLTPEGGRLYFIGGQ